MLHLRNAAIRLGKRCLGVIVVLAVCLVANELRAGEFDWPQFLGPNRNGVSAETGLMESWPQDGPKEVWRAECRGGMSGSAIADGKLFTLAQSRGKQWAVAFDATDGKQLWETAIAPAFGNSMGDGPRATPAVTGEFVFTYTGDGVLSALNVKDGSIVWSVNAVESEGGKVADYGMASSPLVVGENVIVTVGAPGAAVAAYNQKTGKLTWKAGRGIPAGYSSAALFNIGGKSQLVAFLGTGAMGVNPALGTVLWSYPYETDYNCNTATPIAVADDVLISSGENHGSTMLSLTSTDDRFRVGEAWSSTGTGSVLRAEWQTPVLIDGYLYGFDNVGSAGPVTHLTCVDASNGKRMWQKARFGKGNLIAADGKLFITTMKGELVLVKATSEEYEEFGRATLTETTRQAPSLANGLLYLRDGKEVICVDVRGK